VHGVSTARASEADRADARRHVPGLHGAPFALVLGRLDPVKGQDVALEAFARAASEDLHLVLAGSVTDPEFAAEVTARACSIPRVHVVAGVAPAVARALLAEATIVIVPSRAEAFGIVLLEAWAEGTPALYADVGGLAELGRDAGDDFGRVATPTPDSFAAALRRALESPTALAREAARGPERVRPYGWDSVAARVAASYERATRGELP
jgi:glycosyltransferase involved in cell wall biosynthesis